MISLGHDKFPTAEDVAHQTVGLFGVNQKGVVNVMQGKGYEQPHDHF
jgi:hypothetical protein